MNTVSRPDPSRADDERFLRDAIALALASRDAGNHPFGAVIAIDGVAVARAQNSVVTARDATGHAEMNALRAIAGTTSADRMRATIYTSTEPCVMCSGAIYWGELARIVYGCPAEALARVAGESLLIPCRTILARGAHAVAVVGPLLEEEAIVAHDDFWR